MDVLIIGGTRNLGHFLALDLLEAGNHVTVLNRGRTRDDLPAEIERLRADRSDAEQLRAALAARSFDLVVDTALLLGKDAAHTIDLLDGRVGHYVFISTGQVYLVREGIAPPFREEDYDGAVMAAPAMASPDFDQWTYGVEKRAIEDALADAHARRGFPYTSLRLPMVNSERDHFDRIRNYLARLDDGNPILLPAESGRALRHVYAGDVVRAVRLVSARATQGRAYNISQDETVTLEDFLELLGGLARRELRIVRLPRSTLEAHGLLPGASPFSGRWMSELDNSRSKAELGLRYTPLPQYLAALVAAYRNEDARIPLGYERRPLEVEVAAEGEVWVG